MRKKSSMNNQSSIFMYKSNHETIFFISHSSSYIGPNQVQSIDPQNLPDR